MQHYRVTKYDPARRDASGAYPSNDWTSRSDIGQSFGGVPLTEERYVAVESAYLDAASAFLNEAGVRELVIVGLEKAAAHDRMPSEGEVVLADRIPTVLRALLREQYWCRPSFMWAGTTTCTLGCRQCAVTLR